jgi:tetratricopeptide (TPR) repeat protein
MLGSIGLLMAACVLLSAAPGETPNFDAYDGHMRMGQAYLQSKESGKAVSEFESAVRLRPGSAAAQYNLGAALRLWGDPAGAEAALREALKLQPGMAEAHFVLGLVLGDYVGSESRGLQEFQAALSLNPDFADAHFNVGIVRWKQNDVNGAVGSFQRAVNLKPDSAEFRFRLGQALARNGQTLEASRELERAVELKPDHEAARYQLLVVYRKLGENDKAHQAADALNALRERGTKSVGRDQSGLEYNAGLTALERGHIDESIEKLTRALAQPHDEAAVRDALGIAWQRKGNLAAAQTEFEKAVQLNPQSADAHLNLGVLMMRQGKADAAGREFRLAISLNPNFAEARFNLGLAMASQKRWREAVETLQAAIRLDPGNARVHCNLARVLRDSDQPGRALDAYRTAWELDQNLSELGLEYGRMLHAQDRPDEALAVWRSSWIRHPLNPALEESIEDALDARGDREESDRQRQISKLLAGSRYLRGVESLNGDDLPRAIAVFQGVLTAHPDWLPVRWSLASALYSHGDYAASAAQYRILVQASPTDSDLRLQLGNALREMHVLDDARETLQQSIRLNAHSARAYYQLGLVELAAKDLPRATEQFHRARRIDPRLEPPHEPAH